MSKRDKEFDEINDNKFSSLILTLPFIKISWMIGVSEISIKCVSLYSSYLTLDIILEL